jgi:hypothetical protein
MPRTASQGRGGFIWFPRTVPVVYKVLINGVDVTVDINPDAQFTMALCPDIYNCQIDLFNPSGYYTGMFSVLQNVELYMDLVNGTTKMFSAKIDTIQDKYDTSVGYLLHIEASQTYLNKITVIAVFNGTNSLQSILQYLITNYMPSLTLNYTSSYSGLPIIAWQNKPFWDCITDLIKIAQVDAFVDANLVLNVADKGTVMNNNEAVVWNDTLVDMSKLGKQIVTTKNQAIVYGADANGLPVLSTVNSSSSQTTNGISQLVLNDPKITTPAQASAVGTSQIASLAIPSDEGEIECLIMPSLKPGDNIWITNPPVSIHNIYRISYVVHKIPAEKTTVYVNNTRTMLQMMKQISTNQISLQDITNPYNMQNSFNVSFADSSQIQAKDSNVSVSNGALKLSSGTQGSFTVLNNAASSVSQLQLVVAGSSISFNIYQISTDGGSNYQQIYKDLLTVLTSPGTNILLKTTLNSASTEMDSLAILYK